MKKKKPASKETGDQSGFGPKARRWVGRLVKMGCLGNGERKSFWGDDLVWKWVWDA